MTIGAAARASGVNIETIRYYEREGVVPKPTRSPSGRRLYSGKDIANLRFVKRSRELGFSIPDIKLLLRLPSFGRNSCDEAREVGERNLALVQQKIRDLRNMELALKELISNCHSGQPNCPMLEDLFED